jgi:diaminohydroxyphosphoribosylaminopyrimidine deaminase/5-amino-6-(5-phosphoribosylamino)uracil reductase
MKRCLQLAKLGAGNVAPNPMVGAILVFEDRIIGEGYHQFYGKAHAEVNCINSVGNEDKRLIRDSTLYVSLEPCSHFGKTPPCTDLILAGKIPRVFIGCRDAYEKVNGTGIEKLEASGVYVNCGILEKECVELNKRFFLFHSLKRPYIILKWAQSINGRIAQKNGERVFITNDISNRLVHRWRSEEAGILVGTNTAALDDPALSTRLWEGNHPVRMVIDMELKLSATIKLFDNTIPTIVFNEVKEEENENLAFIKITGRENNLQEVMNILYEKNIQSILVEGGATLLQSFIDKKLWDEARVFTNNHLVVREGIPAPQLSDYKIKASSKIFSDELTIYKPIN